MLPFFYINQQDTLNFSMNCQEVKLLLTLSELGDKNSNMFSQEIEKKCNLNHLLPGEMKVCQQLNFFYQTGTPCPLKVIEFMNIFLILMSTKLREIEKFADKIYQHLPTQRDIDKEIKYSNSHKQIIDDIQKQLEKIYLEYKQTQKAKQKCDDVQLEKNPTINCPGCKQFYYIYMNICKEQINKCMIILVGSINEIKNNKQNLLTEICALLNTGGGILLFNCYRSGLSVIPKGQNITQDKKDRILQTIADLLKQINPQIIIGKEVKVTFVPIKQNPFEKDKCYQKRINTKGLYVTRIRVSPRNGHTYALKKMIPIDQNHISGYKETITYIQKQQQVDKFKQKRSFEYKDETKKFSNFDHDQCKMPNLGEFIFIQNQEILYSIPKILNNENAYQFSSILICGWLHIQKVEQKLKKLKINCQIGMPYQKIFQPKPKEPNISIICHNVKFNKLLSIIRDKEFKFDDKYTKVILITKYLQVPANVQTFILLRQLLQNYPEEYIAQWWQYINQKKQTQIYLQTKTINFSLYIYLVLKNHYTEAIFKNQEEIEKKKKKKKKNNNKQQQNKINSEFRDFRQICPEVKYNSLSFK